MAILVTGASGFVGSFLAEQANIVPLALDQHPIDISDAQAVVDAVGVLRPDAVVHLAAQSSVPASLADPMATYRVNVLGTLNLLQALVKTRFAGRLLFVSSGDVYGIVSEPDLPVTETQHPQPGNPYAVSKLAGEALCRQWMEAHDLDIVLARPFNHIGPRQDTRFAVADFAKQAVRASLGLASPELLVGDIDATRDFTDVRDIVAAYLTLITHGQSGQTYNICSGSERSLRDIVSSLGTALGIPLSTKVQIQRLRPSEQRRMRGSHAKLHMHTGWQPQISFEQTLRDIIDYWKLKEQS